MFMLFPLNTQAFVTISPSPSPAAMFYWRGNNTSTSNDRLEICFKLFASAVGFQFLLSAGILAPACFCQRDIARCPSQDIWISPALLLVSPLNNLINVHTVPNAPDSWVILIQILQSFSVYPLLVLLPYWVTQVVGADVVDIHPKKMSPWCFLWSRLVLSVEHGWWCPCQTPGNQPLSCVLGHKCSAHLPLPCGFCSLGCCRRGSHHSLEAARVSEGTITT